MLISVVVPVYNVEKYIKECIDSLVNQTYKEIEIIVVDDGSKDNSISIVEEYNDERIRIVHKKNGGLSDARNYGLKYANGEYVCFIDSDDSVDTSLFEKCRAYIDKYDSDIVCFDIVYCYEDGTKKISPAANFEVSSYKDNKEIVKINHSACNKLFKTTFMKGKEFPVGIYYEDLAVIPYWISLANNVSHINEGLYFYNQRESSISHEVNEKLFDIYIALDNLKGKIDNDILNEMIITQGLKLTTLRIKEDPRKEKRLMYYKKNIELLTNRLPNWYLLVIKNANIKERIIYYFMYKRKYNIVDWLFHKND